MSQRPTFEIKENHHDIYLLLHGWWHVHFWPEMESLAAKFPGKPKRIRIDFSSIQKLDTFGAWLLKSYFKKLQRRDVPVHLENCSQEHQKLLDDLMAFEGSPEMIEDPKISSTYPLEFLGKKGVDFYHQCIDTTSFLGEVVVTFLTTFWQPYRFRYRSFFQFVEETGFFALPIVGLISFLIGVVMVYQGATQLERFGAAIFTVNLLAISILRELGILITSIVVAGRSGSSFTAQIGFMKLNQEIDAMLTIGLNPMEVLVLPRVTALIVTLPLLTLYADFMGLLGGGFMALHLIDLSWKQFFQQLQVAVGPWTFWTGMIKAPIFASVISIIGCYEGSKVSGGAEDVGRRTTRSVVRSIFMIIALDALFSVIYSKLEI